MSKTFYYLFIMFGRGNWRIPKKELTEFSLSGWADNWFKDYLPQKEIDEAIAKMLEFNAIEDCGTYYRICDDIRSMRRETRNRHFWSNIWNWDEDRWEFVDKLKARFEGQVMD